MNLFIKKMYIGSRKACFKGTETCTSKVSRGSLQRMGTTVKEKKNQWETKQATITVSNHVLGTSETKS